MRLPIVAAFVSCLATSAQAQTPKSYTGRALPFEVITAIRNYGFKEGMRPAQVAVSVQGGSQADWLATAAYVAEKSIVPDVTYSTVEVHVATPWGDLPPTRSKQLAKAYYGGPEPTKSPWPEDPFSTFAVGHAPTLADVEFDELTNNLLDDDSSNDDPEKASAAADAKAIAMLRKKYRLPRAWKPNDDVGMTGSDTAQVKRNQITVSDTAGADASLPALVACLTKPDPTNLFRGCQDRSTPYSFHP